MLHNLKNLPEFILSIGAATAELDKYLPVPTG